MIAEFVAVGDIKLFSKVHRQGANAQWLVFSNSLMTDHTVWDAQIKHFSDRFNILVYDQRGHGRSGLSGALTFDDLAGDVLALLDHYQIADCIYVGLSMGVPTGLGAVGRQPSRFSRLILSDGQMATQPSGREAWQARIDSARANGMAWVARQTVDRWFGPDFVRGGGADELVRIASGMDVEGYCACAAALQEYDFTSVARTISAPVLLIAGAKDGAMPATMEAMAESIPGAQFRVVAAAGHIPNLEQPQRFNALMDRFLAQKP